MRIAALARPPFTRLAAQMKLRGGHRQNNANRPQLPNARAKVWTCVARAVVLLVIRLLLKPCVGRELLLLVARALLMTRCCRGPRVRRQAGRVAKNLSLPTWRFLFQRPALQHTCLFLKTAEAAGRLSTHIASCMKLAGRRYC